MMEILILREIFTYFFGKFYIESKQHSLINSFTNEKFKIYRIINHLKILYLDLNLHRNYTAIKLQKVAKI